jgi:hypothetical protein
MRNAWECVGSGKCECDGVHGSACAWGIVGWGMLRVFKFKIK